MQFHALPAAVLGAAARSVTEMAARSGVSRPTLYRILGGAAPRADDLEELALAGGYVLDVRLTALSDPLAGVAARLELGDDSVAPWADAADAWRGRLRRFVDASGRDDRDIAFIDEGGRAGAPAERSGAVHLRGDHQNVDRLVSAGRASGGRWALSGWAALDASGLETDAPTVMWAEDATGTAQLLHGSFSTTRSGAADLIVVPAHPSVFAGAGPVEDVELVAPLQAFLDAVGLGADVRREVLAHVGRLR